MAVSTRSKPESDPQGYRTLAAAIVLQAVTDLSDKDPIKSLDAFMWLIYGGADIYLEPLDIGGGALGLLRMVQKNGGNKHGHKKYRLTGATS